MAEPFIPRPHEQREVPAAFEPGPGAPGAAGAESPAQQPDVLPPRDPEEQAIEDAGLDDDINR